MYYILYIKEFQKFFILPSLLIYPYPSNIFNIFIDFQNSSFQSLFKFNRFQSLILHFFLIYEMRKIKSISITQSHKKNSHVNPQTHVDATFYPTPHYSLCFFTLPFFPCRIIEILQIESTSQPKTCLLGRERESDMEA